MEDTRFDTMAKVLGALTTRRLTVGALLGGVLGFPAVADGATKRSSRRCKPECGECQKCKKGKCHRTRSGKKRCSKGKCKPKDDGIDCGTCRECQGGTCVNKPELTPCVGGPNPDCAIPNGCVCHEGACVQTMISDRDLKADFAPADTWAVLDQVARLPIQTWRYRGEETQVRHMGPMAQDFAATFALGSDPRHILAVDGQGVALAAIQALHREMQALTERLAALEAGHSVGVCPASDGS
jgi:hypothetical protein